MTFSENGGGGGDHTPVLLKFGTYIAATVKRRRIFGKKDYSTGYPFCTDVLNLYLNIFGKKMKMNILVQCVKIWDSRIFLLYCTGCSYLPVKLILKNHDLF